jgi:hypothetical protein
MKAFESQPGVFRHLFGDRWTVALELETNTDAPDPGTWGSLWLWFEGQVIGNTDSREQLGVAANWLQYIAMTRGQRPDSVFGNLDARQKLRLFEFWYSRSDGPPPFPWWREPGFPPELYLLSDTQAGPSFDDWWVVLSEIDGVDIATWRPPNSDLVLEARFPTPTISDLALQFCKWLHRP